MPNVELTRRARLAATGPVERRVCAQHGRDVMGWKSPEAKAEGDRTKISMASTTSDGHLVIHRKETFNEARLRHQQATSARSFHGAIWGSKDNHAKVTAYDIAIGRGRAVTDPGFYRYLCAVADWRLKKLKKGDPIRPGILTWEAFSSIHKQYLDVEEKSRKAIIEGNSDYYSIGILPGCINSIAERPQVVIAETTDGRSPPVKKSDRPT